MANKVFAHTVYNCRFTLSPELLGDDLDNVVNHATHVALYKAWMDMEQEMFDEPYNMRRLAKERATGIPLRWKAGRVNGRSVLKLVPDRYRMSRKEPNMYHEQKQVYIAGPMRGHVDYNFPAFYQAEAMLDLWGFKVRNPARMDVQAGKAAFNRATGTVIPDTSFKIEEVLRRDFDAIRQVNAIVVLPGWETSQGAQRELAFAQSIGIPVYAYDAHKPLSLEAKPLNLKIDIRISNSDDLPF